MTDSEDWQPQQYDPATHAQRIGAGQQQEPWQQYPPQYDPRGPQQWGPPARQPRRRSWPRRHKLISSLLAVLAALIALVVVSVASQPASPTAATTTGLPACASHHAVTSRQWLEIAKNPDAAKGQCITVYGEITQFDAATGAAGFLAQVGGARLPVSFGYADYPTNVVLAGTAADLAPFVEGDLFTAQVTVAGHITYDTQAGGSTTAPTLRIDSLTRIGHLSS
jgi:hypothetical protein